MVYGSIVLSFYYSIVIWFYCSMALGYYDHMVLWSYRSMVLRFYDYRSICLYKGKIYPDSTYFLPRLELHNENNKPQLVFMDQIEEISTDLVTVGLAALIIHIKHHERAGGEKK